jgi:hypothetical protein
MKRLTSVLMALFLFACAHGKMGQIDQPLEKGAINKGIPVFVEAITAKDASFAGDKADDKQRISEEQAAIQQLYAKTIAEALRSKGYDAKAATGPVTSGVVISGNVTRFDHGSAAKRVVGWGGQSVMHSNFKIEDRSASKPLAKFEIIATSGGRSGLQAMGGFMDEHFKDGADKLADYVANAK